MRSFWWWQWDYRFMISVSSGESSGLAFGFSWTFQVYLLGFWRQWTYSAACNNRYKSGLSLLAELRQQISAAPGLPRQQPELATSKSSCKCEDNYQILPCFYNLAYCLLGARFSLALEDSGQTLKVISPRGQRKSQNGSWLPRTWLFCAFSAISVVSLFPASPTTSVLEFSGKALYTLQSKCPKCFSISNWK